MALLTAHHHVAMLARRTALAFLCLTGLSAWAAPSEYEIKAAFLYQITKFVEWPPSRSADPPRLCLLGGNPFGAALEGIRGKPVGGRPLEVTPIGPESDIRRCTLLFIAAPAERSLERIVVLAHGAGILTFGDTEGFAQRGVMVNFLEEDGRVRFEIHLEAARRSGLKISSRLLSLARIVE